MKPVTERDSPRKLLPLKFFRKSSSVFSSFPHPFPLCPSLFSYQLPRPARPLSRQGLLGVLRDDRAFYRGLRGSWPYPWGSHNGEVTGQASRAGASSTPSPSSLPASQVVAFCSPDAPISRAEGQMALFPQGPQASLEDWASASSPGIHQPGGGGHSLHRCSTDSSCLGVCRRRGRPSLSTSLPSEPQFPCSMK